MPHVVAYVVSDVEVMRANLGSGRHHLFARQGKQCNVIAELPAGPAVVLPDCRNSHVNVSVLIAATGKRGHAD